MAISELTRRDLADLLGDTWHGRLDQVQFLSRLYDLSSLPSKDSRFRTMAEDITQHTINNDDWPSDWIFGDSRLSLDDDARLMRLVAESLHPLVVAKSADAESLAAAINALVRLDGWELHRTSELSGRPVYTHRLLESTYQDELVRLAAAAAVLAPISGAIELTIVAFRQDRSWIVAGSRLRLCAEPTQEVMFRNERVLIQRRVITDLTRWDEFYSAIAGGGNLVPLMNTPEIAPLVPSPWTLGGDWQEEAGRSVQLRLPVLRARRTQGPLASEALQLRRLLSSLEDTDYLDSQTVQIALGIDLPRSVSDLVVVSIEVEFPVGVTECRLVTSDSQSVLRTSLTASPAVKTELFSLSTRCNTEPITKPAALSSAATGDDSWQRLLAETPARGDETGVRLRLVYGMLSVLLPERGVLRAEPPSSLVGDARAHIVVVERVLRRVPIGPPSLPPTVEVADENTGFQFGNWLIGKRVGTGSYGRVYKAEHTLTGQTASCKLIATTEKAAAERFRREARCLGTLRHPQVPGILDAGLVKEEELAYILQELLIGADLEALLGSGWRATEPEILELLQQLTSPLSLAHDAGIVHRDLKPANLFLEGPPTGRILRVLDFGCAKLVGASKLTSAGVPIGTIAYQPPEAFASTAEVGTAADSWSIGVTAYELLTGTQPFLAGDYARTIARITRADYVRLDPVVYPHVAGIVDACLQLDASQRPQDAETLATLCTKALDRVHSGLDFRVAESQMHHRGPLALWLDTFVRRVRSLPRPEQAGALLAHLLGSPLVLQAAREFFSIPQTVPQEEFAVWISATLARLPPRDGFAALRTLTHAASDIPRV